MLRSSTSRLLPPLRRSALAAPSSTAPLRPCVKASSRRSYASVPDFKGRARAEARVAVGPFTPLSAGLFVATGIALFWYFRNEKAKVEARKAEEIADAKVGNPRIGGEFSLIMPVNDGKEGRKVTHEDIKGAWTLLYFGFTNCPDICPEELDKMGKVVDSVDASHGAIINPVFVTCDPARDTLAATAIYVSEFHPRLIGLTGSYEDVKAACKAYRVYFSTPPGASASDDYLVDHSIFFYLMDPEGKFVDAFGRSQSAEDVTRKVTGFIEKWKAAGNDLGNANAKKRLLEDESRKVLAQ